jgi:hypothetical protein
MAHSFHDGLPGYDERQILHDGCAECEHRGKDLVSALAHMDKFTFARAWRRAYDWQASNGGGYEATGNISHAEYTLLKVLWGMMVTFERFGQPLDGRVPDGVMRIEQP